MFVERSSYEPHALGRMEWIKVYGTLLGCEDKAEKLFADKVDGTQLDILQKPAAGKTVFVLLHHVERCGKCSQIHGLYRGNDQSGRRKIHF